MKVYEFEAYDYSGCTQWGDKRRTTARVHTLSTYNGVFCNSCYNTYVMVKPPADMTDWQKQHLVWPNGFALCSINGIGEIRWDVTPKEKMEYHEAGDREAIGYFNMEGLKFIVEYQEGESKKMFGPFDTREDADGWIDHLQSITVEYNAYWGTFCIVQLDKMPTEEDIAQCEAL